MNQMSQTIYSSSSGHLVCELCLTNKLSNRVANFVPVGSVHCKASFNSLTMVKEILYIQSGCCVVYALNSHHL